MNVTLYTLFIFKEEKKERKKERKKTMPVPYENTKLFWNFRYIYFYQREREKNFA